MSIGKKLFTRESKLQNNLAVIRKRFVEKVKSWVPSFEAFYEALEKKKLEGIDLQDLRVKAHQLAGSAKTFGFPEITACSSLIEDGIDRLLKHPGEQRHIEELLPLVKDYLKQAQTLELHSNELPKDYITQSSITGAEKTTFEVLIADDDVLISDLIKHGLDDKNCKVSAVHNGQELLDKVKEKHYHLIILDINMPKLNGLETLKALKANEATQNIPTLMLTKQDASQYLLDTLCQGALDYITKPFDIKDLIHRIHLALGLQNKKVLVVDGDELLCELLESELNKISFITSHAQNDKEALRKALLEKPDLILLETSTKMNTSGILRQLQTVEELAKIPVILLCEEENQFILHKALEKGAYNFIHKPFDLQKIIARSCALLYESSLRESR